MLSVDSATESRRSVGILPVPDGVGHCCYLTRPEASPVIKVGFGSQTREWGPSVSSRRCVSLILSLVVSACASSPNPPFGEDFETATETSRGNTNLIVRAELELFAGQSAYRTVDTLPPALASPPRGR